MNTMNNLYDVICKRKSTRSYLSQKLSFQQLQEIIDYVENLLPLYPEIAISYTIEDSVKNILPVVSPHYLIISSEPKEGYLENIGFMFQQVDLFLSSKGYGSCWLGMAKPQQLEKSEQEYLISIAFGLPKNSPYRAVDEFKRKSLQSISEGEDDRLESARLAPSANNIQNWFFSVDLEKIYVYEKKTNPITSLMYNKMLRMNIGIALCHLYIASLHKGITPIFSTTGIPDKTGYVPIGAISS